MFYDSNEFKVLEAGVQLSWLQQKLSTQNIANIETPGYKSKSLSFDSVLSAVQKESEDSGDSEISKINASVVSDDSVSKQPDGNNVDLENESIALYKAYAQYSVLLNQVKTEFNKYSSVLNSNM